MSALDVLREQTHAGWKIDTPAGTMKLHNPEVCSFCCALAEVEALVTAARAYLDEAGVNAEPILDDEYREEMLRNWGAEAVDLVDALALFAEDT